MDKENLINWLRIYIDDLNDHIISLDSIVSDFYTGQLCLASSILNRLESGFFDQ